MFIDILKFDRRMVCDKRGENQKVCSHSAFLFGTALLSFVKNSWVQLISIVSALLTLQTSTGNTVQSPPNPWPFLWLIFTLNGLKFWEPSNTAYYVVMCITEWKRMAIVCNRVVLLGIGSHCWSLYANGCAIGRHWHTPWRLSGAHECTDWTIADNKYHLI